MALWNKRALFHISLWATSDPTQIKSNLRWCFSTVTNSATVVCSTPMFLHIRLAKAQTPSRTMTSPVEQTSESPRDQCHWQVFGKPKKQHAKSRAKQTAEKHLLPPNPVAETPPENAAKALHECER